MGNIDIHEILPRDWKKIELCLNKRQGPKKGEETGSSL
jgi:hypothetical protein